MIEEMTMAAAADLSPQDAERLRAYERRRHDALAESYHGFFAAVTARAIEPLLAAVRLEPGAWVLDVATGGGLLAAEAARRGARVVGIDLSPGMLEQARKRHPDIDFRIGEVEHLPFPAASFDAVVCSFGLGHFPRPEASVAECMRTLKPGGRIALSWWDDSRQQRIQGLFREAIAEVGAEPPPDVPKGHSSMRFCDAGELRRLLESAGLAEVAVEEHRMTHLVRDVETLWRGGLGSLVMATAAITNQDAATQTAIRAAVARRAAAYQTPDGLDLPIAFRVGAGRKPE
jgi:2-polyprenyl-3-methyl-5-hydroxy-6-metoxy-1,4-benzoquinol methylase